MTKEELFKKMLEDDLFQDINQSKEVEDFLLARTANFLVFKESTHYRKLQGQKESFEDEFKRLYENPETGEKRVSEYIDLIAEMGAIADALHFQKGFFEGFKFLLVMILYSGGSDDETLYPRRDQ